MSMSQESDRFTFVYRRQRNRRPQVSTNALPGKMMKVAIVGTNGFARMLAHWIATHTSHQFIILSRNVCFYFPLRPSIR